MCVWYGVWCMMHVGVCMWYGVWCVIPGGVYGRGCVLCVWYVCVYDVCNASSNIRPLLEQRIGFLSQRLILIGINRFLLPYA